MQPIKVNIYRAKASKLRIDSLVILKGALVLGLHAFFNNGCVVVVVVVCVSHIRPQNWIA